MLDKSHLLTELIVREMHSKVLHLGIQATLNRLRMAGFRIPKPRQTIKKVIRPCVICQKFNNVAFKYPGLTNLPEDRVNLVRAFQNVGVDYTGPVLVLDYQGMLKLRIHILVIIPKLVTRNLVVPR